MVHASIRLQPIHQQSEWEVLVLESSKHFVTRSFQQHCERRIV
jgi:hypothetical protein